MKKNKINGSRSYGSFDEKVFVTYRGNTIAKILKTSYNITLPMPPDETNPDAKQSSSLANHTLFARKDDGAYPFFPGDKPGSLWIDLNPERGVKIPTPIPPERLDIINQAYTQRFYSGVATALRDITDKHINQAVTLNFLEKSKMLFSSGNDFYVDMDIAIGFSFLSNDFKKIKISFGTIKLRATGKDGTGMYLDSIETDVPLIKKIFAGQAEALPYLKTLREKITAMTSKEQKQIIDIIDASDNHDDDALSCTIEQTKVLLRDINNNTETESLAKVAEDASEDRDRWYGCCRRRSF